VSDMAFVNCTYCGRPLGDVRDDFSPPFICYKCADAAAGLDTTQAILLIVAFLAVLYGLLQLFRSHGWSWPF